MRHPIRKNIRIKRLPFTVCSFLKEKVRHKESGYRASQQTQHGDDGCLLAEITQVANDKFVCSDGQSQNKK